MFTYSNHILVNDKYAYVYLFAVLFWFGLGVFIVLYEFDKEHNNMDTKYDWILFLLFICLMIFLIWDVL